MSHALSVQESTPRAHAVASPKLELRHGDIGTGVVARAAIAAGEPLIALAHVFTREASRYTIQLGADRHQAGTGEIDDFLNHSCEPNAVLDVDRLMFVALRPIPAGAPITFNYLTSEWDMAEPFSCRCGAQGCFGTIAGFRHLSPAQQRALLPLATPYLRSRAADPVALPSAA